MKITTRLSMTIVLTFVCACTSMAQEQTPPAIEVTTEGERAQFSVQGQVRAVHVEIFSPSGELVFESDSLSGQAVEWQMRNDRGERVADGVYLATITVTDSSGKRRKRIEQIVVSSEDQEKQVLEAAVPPVAVVGPINGQGTTGKLAKFTGANAIGDSILTESITKRIGINIAPTATLQVNAAQPPPLATNGTAATTLLQTSGGKGGNTTGAAAGVQLGGTGASISLVAGNGGDAPAGDTRGKGGNITLQPGSTGGGTGTAGLSGNVLISPSGVGNVGIGTASPASRLTVNGGIQILGASNGIKFGDGSIQTKADTGSGGLLSVTHNATLVGAGTAASPLSVANLGVGNAQLANGAVTGPKIALPLIITGNNTSRLISVKNTNTVSGAVAVYGETAGGYPGGGGGVVGVSTNSFGAGVIGTTSDGYGVYGITTSGFGVAGTSFSGPGVSGYSSTGVGVNGYSSTNDAVLGISGSPNHAGVVGSNDRGGNAGYFAGNVQVTGNVCARNISCASDARLKQGIANLNYGLHQLMRLRPVSWHWKSEPEGNLQMGLVAQEVERVMPELVLREADATKPLGLNYMALLPVAIKAIQEQQKLIKQLRAQMSQQQAQLQQQQAQLNQVKRTFSRKRTLR